MKKNRLPIKVLSRILFLFLFLFMVSALPAGTIKTQAATFKNISAICPLANKKVVKQVKKHGGRFITTNNFPDGAAGLTSARFYIRGGKKHMRLKIYILPESLGTVVSYHELGHCVDFLCSKMRSVHNQVYVKLKSDTSLFKKIYYFEKDKYTPLDDMTSRSYVTSSSMEYFAQSFAEYTMHPAAFRAMCPYTFEYIHKCVKQIKKGNVIPK